MFGTTDTPGKVGGHKVTRIKAYLSLIPGYPALLNVTAMKVLSRKKQKFFFFIFINSANDNYDKEKEEYYGLTVSSNGDVGWFYPTIFKSSCTIDVTYFPFDDQVGENV